MATEEATTFTAPEGTGTALAEIDVVAWYIEKVPSEHDLLKACHQLFYSGSIPETSKLKEQLSQFKGFPSDASMEEKLKENLSTDPWNEACLKELCQFFDLDSKEGGKDQLIERCVTFLMKPTATNMTTIEALDKSRKSKTVKIATKKKSSSSSKKRKSSSSSSSSSSKKKKKKQKKSSKKSSRAAVVPTDVAQNSNKKTFSLKTIAKTAVVGKKMAKTFKTFRSSNHLDSSAKKIKLKANPILKRDPNMTDEEAEADALVRTVIKTRRMKKILQAKLNSLRVQENIQFALEHNLDAGELNMARADIITACTRLTEPFEIETGPLVNALKKVRTLQQDIQFIEDLESGGFRNVVEMLDSQLNDLIDEKK